MLTAWPEHMPEQCWQQCSSTCHRTGQNRTPQHKRSRCEVCGSSCLWVCALLLGGAPAQEVMI